MTPTPEHIERLALLEMMDRFVVHHSCIECFDCRKRLTSDSEPGDTSADCDDLLIDKVRESKWRVKDDLSHVYCPDCAAAATEEQA